MTKRQIAINLIIISALIFFAFNLIFPNYFNLPYMPNRDFRLGLDLQGGSHLVYEADLSKINAEEQADSMDGLRDVIERRVNVFGVTEPLVVAQKAGESYRLIVELAGISDIKEAIKMIGETPYLEFKEERDIESRDKILAKQEELDGMQFEDIESVEDWQLAFEDPYFISTNLNGAYLKGAQISIDQTAFEPQVNLEFNDEGAEIFKKLTSENVGKRLAIYIDNTLISAPVVNEAISKGKAQISGSFTIQEAKELARNLNAGALPVPIKLISQTTVGPALGLISLEKSLKAAVYGFLAVCLFMLVFYRLSGFLACLALIVYAGILLCLFKFIPVTLSLAGIGGAILSVGMAVDANVLIFERQKEERIRGESFSSALSTGFSRAWPSIRDSNFTTLLVALIMFSFGTSFVKGFALTLSLGILVSMFSAFFITKTLMYSFIGTKLEKIRCLWR